MRYFKVFLGIREQFENPTTVLKDYVFLSDKDEQKQYRFRNGLVMNTGYREDIQILFSIFFHKVYGEVGSGLTIIDIGGNIGAFSIFAAHKNNNRVFTFEPSSSNHALIRSNLNSNDLAGDVTLVKKAVSGQVGTVEMASNRGGFSTIVQGHDSESYQRRATTEDTTEMVDTIPLAQVFEDYDIDTCDILKVDCEGSEYDILFNAPDALFPRIREIRMECDNIDDARNPDTMIAFLEGKGYSITDSKGGIIFAVRNT